MFKKLSPRITIGICVYFFLAVNLGFASNSDLFNNPPDDFVVHPALAGNAFQSSHYRVRVSQNGVQKDSYVYMHDNDFDKPNTRSQMTDYDHWTSFSFSGSVTVEVTLLNSTGITSAKVLPTSFNVPATIINNNTVSFTLDRTRNVFLELIGVSGVNNVEKHPIFVFANPLETDVPPNSGSDVLYFSPGTHNVNGATLRNKKVIYFAPGEHTLRNNDFAADHQYAETMVLDGNVTVYLAGGAYVKGLIVNNQGKGNIEVKGRGVLSAEGIPWWPTWGKQMVYFRGGRTQGLAIKDIVLVHPSKSFVVSEGGVMIDNIKCLGFGHNSDGVSAGAGSIIKNSFFKVNDDVIKLYYSNMKVFNNVIWSQPLGSVFQLSWNIPRDVTNIDVYDIDIIRTDRTVYNRLTHNNSIISARNYRGGSSSNIRFKDIRIESQPYQLFRLAIKDPLNGFTQGDGFIRGISMLNFYLKDKPLVKSVFESNGISNGVEIENIELCNLYHANTLFTQDDFIITDPAKTGRINLTGTTIHGDPIAQAGPDKTLDCGQAQVTIGTNIPSEEGYSYQWTANGGNIVSGANQPRAIVNRAGTYVLNVTHTFTGCSNTDEVIVSANGAPNADAGADKTLDCTRTEVTLGTPSIAGMAYQWTTTNGNIVSGGSTSEAVVDKPGTYTLIETDISSSCSASDIVLVTENFTPPVIDLESEQELILGETITIGAPEDASYTYFWTTTEGNIVTGENLSQITVDRPGKYTLEITKRETGCSAQYSVIVLQKEGANDSIRIYPVPIVENELNIDIDKEKEFAMVIYDGKGSAVLYMSLEGGKNKVDVGNLQNGVCYLIFYPKISNGAKVITRKIIMNN